MARFLKNAYFKVSSHPKFCSYATKANPYEEVLKTLRLWEQELKSKSEKSSLRDNNEHLPGHSVPHNEITLNVQKDLHLTEDVNAINLPKRTIKKENERYCDSTLPKSELVSDNCDILQGKFNNRKQASENGSKNIFPEEEEILIFTGKHSSNRFIHMSGSKLLVSLKSNMCPQENIRSDQHSEKRTTNKSMGERESSKAKKKKSKTKAKTSLSEIKEIKISKDEHASNNLVSIEEITNKELHENELPKTKKKKSKSKAKTASLSEIKEIRIPKEEDASNNLESLKEIENLLEDLERTDSTELTNSLTQPEKKFTKKSSDKKLQKSESSVKSKKFVGKSVGQLYDERENLKKEAKLNYAVQSLKSSIEAYINSDKVDQAQKYFEYVNKRKKEYLNVEIYNSIISGWAKLGQLDKVKQLLSHMLDDNIQPNLMTYAGYLEAVARSKFIDVAEIPDIINKVKAQGYSSKDLLQKCVFLGNQREKILQVLGFVERDLTVPLYVPEDAYSFKLLEKLNDKEYEKGENPFDYCFQTEDIPKISATQMEIERLSSIKIKSVNTVPEINNKVKKSREYLNICEKQWRETLTKKINELKMPKSEKKGNLFFWDKRALHAYLSLIDTEVLVNLLLQETRMLAETAEFYSPSVKILYKELGLKIMRQYFMALNEKNDVTKKVHLIYEKYLGYLLDPDLCAKYSPREYWEFLKSKYCEGPTIDISNVCWPYSLIVYMGNIMYDVMTKTICFNPNRVLKKSEDRYVTPAFRIKYENLDVKLYKQIRTHDVFAKLYRDAKLEYLEFDVTLVPMLSPPHPWVKYDSGGLLITKVPFIRFPDYAQSVQSSYYSKVSPSQLNACFDSLNSLSLCPWIINKPILDIVIKIFQEGGSEELDIPLNPANYKIDSKSINGESEESIKMALHKAMREYEKKKGEMTSLWFDCLYKLSIANHFRDKIFWFPHNLDFRGRVYPTPPHFNHLGSDLSRSILLFATGKPLGKKGLDWLKIHLINLTGFKKRASHVERLAYANEMLPEILDSADNPFGKSRWWMTSDKPLQTLACCMEVASAVRHPNPEEYISHYPVHQDGSCNGLQHYAALGRDELGAIEVNLHPSDSPQDVYSGVAALVERERDKDAKDGVEIAQVLNGFITRKVVKQTVMTFVYGVTPYGARLQVLKQLKDMSEFPEKYHHAAATYLMKKIFLSIKEMFTATKRIQDWFTQCAEDITRVTGHAVEWVTPLGLPVIQPYYKETIVRSSKFCVSKSTDSMHYASNFEPYEMPNVRKQKNAFAPNFIHSLDSTHMMLTSLFCHRKGITFVSVHDCYWTHAVTVEAMNKICREQFVSLHSEPILENLSTFFLKKYASMPEINSDLSKKGMKEMKKMQAILSSVPEIGTFDLKKVLDSEYFFS